MHAETEPELLALLPQLTRMKQEMALNGGQFYQMIYLPIKTNKKIISNIQVHEQLSITKGRVVENFIIRTAW